MNTITHSIDIAGNAVPIDWDYVKYVATIKTKCPDTLLCPSGFGHTDPVKHIRPALPILVEKAEFETLISLSDSLRSN